MHKPVARLLRLRTRPRRNDYPSTPAHHRARRPHAPDAWYCCKLQELPPDPGWRQLLLDQHGREDHVGAVPYLEYSYRRGV